MTGLIHKHVKVMLAAYWVLAFILTHLPPQNLPESPLFPGIDKAVHVLLYAGLSYLFSTFRWRLEKEIRPKEPLIAIGLYAILDELTQIPVGRTAEIADLACDLVGIIAGYWFFQRQTRALSASPVDPLQKPH